MRLLLDEMIGARVADGLRAHGLDVDAVVQRPDLRGQPDETVLEQAGREDRVLVTRNVGDFARLATGQPGHGGLVMVTEQAFPQNRNLVGRLVTALIRADEAGRLPIRGQVLYLRPD